MINNYTVCLKEKKEIVKDTLVFVFEKPKGFNFVAGQFIKIVLPQLALNVERGNYRTMSIASPPDYENLEIIIRKGISPFKKTFQALSLGEKIQILGPYGIFTLPQDIQQPVVFLAGGIGITPVRSMLLQSERERSPRFIFLFYSNTNLETAACLEELANLSLPNYNFIPVMTQEELAEWRGEKGFINALTLKKYIPDIKAPTYYVVGPPFFVEAMREILLAENIDSAKIKLESFKNY